MSRVVLNGKVGEPQQSSISVEIPKQREAARWAFRVEITYRFIDDFRDNMLRLSCCAIKLVLICADLRTSSWLSGCAVH